MCPFVSKDKKQNNTFTSDLTWHALGNSKCEIEEHFQDTFFIHKWWDFNGDQTLFEYKNLLVEIESLSQTLLILVSLLSLQPNVKL